MKAVRAMQDGKMAPFESTLLADQLVAAQGVGGVVYRDALARVTRCRWPYCRDS